MKRILPIAVVVLVLVAFCGTLVFLYTKSQAKEVVWKTEKPFVTGITRKTVVTGAIVPRQEVAVKPRVSGVVEELFVQPGQLVKAGQPLARIRILPDLVSLNRAESGVEAAKLALENSKRELDMNEGLFQRQIISDAEVRRFKLEYQLKNNDLESAQANLQLVKEGVSRKSGKVSNVVAATVDGRILEVPVKVGESVIESNTFNAGSTIASVADMKDLIFQGKVDESEVGKLKEEMMLEIKVGALPDTLLKGKLEYIAPKGVTTDGAIQFEIKAAIEVPPGMVIRAGYSANADIVLDRRESVLAVKESLLQFEQGKPFVEVEVAPQKFEKRPVEVGISDGIRIEVKSGLDPKVAIKDPVAPTT